MFISGNTRISYTKCSTINEDTIAFVLLYFCFQLTIMYILTRGLEALTRMLFFKFAIIIIGLCVTIEARKRN